MKYRPATTADVASLCALVNSAYRGESSKAGWTTEADLLDGQRIDREAMLELVQDQNGVILLLLQEDRLVACVNLKKKTDRAYLGMLTVDPQQQAGGLGRMLLEISEKWVVQNWKLRRIEMNVIQKRVELISYYERRGYVRTGRTEPFPYGNERFGVPKVKDLEFVILEKELSA